MIFNYSFFRAYVKLNKQGFRKELLAQSCSSVEKLEMPVSDLYIDQNGIEWHENNREISILGKFYEVISIESNSGKSCIHIIDDEKENEFFSSFFNNKITNSDFFLCLIKIVFGMNLNPEFELDLSNLPSTLKKLISPMNLISDSEFLSDIIRPPAIF